ncbi:hypothetical protein WJU16_07180 [Chitinophaga pollutisoli]|uniref:Uncharacterized protein n=1 Tax=Chitinophaga pollutisoli TaxID=3133966 RepID=A0ABZ2YU76_9BACT
MFYRANGKIDSFVGMGLNDPYLKDQRNKIVLTWNGDDLVRYEAFSFHKDEVTSTKRVDFEYESRALSVDYSKFPDGVGYFILSHLSQEELYLYSKRLVKTMTVSMLLYNMRNVISFAHEVDAKGRLISTEKRNVHYNAENIPEDEQRSFTSFSYDK